MLAVGRAGFHAPGGRRGAGRPDGRGLAARTGAPPPLDRLRPHLGAAHGAPRSGREVARAVSDYQAAVTELAFLRAKMARGSMGDSGMFWHGEALAELYRARNLAVDHPEALTVAIRQYSGMRIQMYLPMLFIKLFFRQIKQED